MATLTTRRIQSLPWLRPSARSLTFRCRHELNGIVSDFLVDTDVFVDHLRGARRFEANSHRVHYSVVTRAELFAGNTATELISLLLAPFRELDVERVVAE